MGGKADIPQKSTVYKEKQGRSPRDSGWVLRLLLVLGGLFAVHLLNIFLQWTVLCRELAQAPSFHSPEYTFVGFSPLHREEIEALRHMPNAAKPGRIYVCFDFFHPAVFLAWNHGVAGDFFDLGPILAALPAGHSRISFTPGSVLLLQYKEWTRARSFGGSFAGKGWARFLQPKNEVAGKNGAGLLGSFVSKPVQKSPSQRVPYLVYFFLPLVLIVVLISASGAGMAAAFFYYVGMFFFFDFEKLFVTVPMAWLFNALGVELPDPWGRVMAVVLALLFLLAAVYGLRCWKNSEMPASGKWLFLFFILMPLALFF